MGRCACAGFRVGIWKLAPASVYVLESFGVAGVGFCPYNDYFVTYTSPVLKVKVFGGVQRRVSR